jgi:hypothetical protein
MLDDMVIASFGCASEKRGRALSTSTERLYHNAVG